MAFTGLGHSNHYGMAAYWAMMALPHGMIGFSSTNAPAAVAPTGGRTPMLGTNPIAIAIPTDRELPMVLDMATTVVARGRIALHAKQDKPLEPGWAFDGDGIPTTDPHAAMKGLLAPIGGYKGYGISLAIDLLCGLMTGSNYGAHFPGFLANNMVDPTDVGSVFGAVSVDSFMDLPEFTAAMDKALREIKNLNEGRGCESDLHCRRDRIRDESRAPRPRHPDPRASCKGFRGPWPGVGHPLPRGLTGIEHACDEALFQCRPKKGNGSHRGNVPFGRQ